MRYRLWVNGKLVGFGPVKYHLPTPTYDTYDLKRFVKPGGNVVCFFVHAVGNAGTGFGSFMPRRGALIAVVEAGTQRIVSDGSWNAMREGGYAEDTPRQSGRQSFVECFEMGRTLDALEYIRRHWGGIAARGATTTWENWNPHSGSLSHRWSAGPTALLNEYVLGIAPTSSGFKTFDVLPSPGDLSSAKGRVPTPLGVAEVRWRRQDRAWRIQVSAPKGSMARVGVLTAEVGSLTLDGLPV